MNELLQRHGCSNVFSVPEGLKELMSDITREVLREQPTKIYEFISNYLSALLITRDHGVLAVKILEDLCDCRPTISERLVRIGLNQEQSDEIAALIQKEFDEHGGVQFGELNEDGEETEVVEAIEESPTLETVLMREKVREADIMKKILQKNLLDEEMTAKVCQITRNAYRDYWYRKIIMKKQLTNEPTEPWEVAAQHTLELYKRTKPTLEELTRATTRIQAAYRAYHVRKNLLTHLQPKKREIPLGLRFESSPEIDLGPLVTIKFKEDDVGAIFDAQNADKHRKQYDSMKQVVGYRDGAGGVPRSTMLGEEEQKTGLSEEEQELLLEKLHAEEKAMIADEQEEDIDHVPPKTEEDEENAEIVEDIAGGDEPSSEVAPTVSSYPDSDAGDFETSVEDIVEEEED